VVVFNALARPCPRLLSLKYNMLSRWGKVSQVSKCLQREVAMCISFTLLLFFNQFVLLRHYLGDLKLI
jgi:hypothetical protein